MTTSTITGTKWHPTDERIDDDRVQALRRIMEENINELETSQFYHDFRKEVQSSPISKHIQKVLASESKMQMIIYGIGSISEYMTSILQLSLAILMKRDFIWIGEVEVFDPILSSTEIKVLEFLGCSVFYCNEDGRRQAMKPTMFFMPHCDLSLYNNLLKANWEPNLLRNVVIFGNSFDSYIKEFLYYSSRDRSSNDTRRKFGYIWKQMGHILSAQKFTNELKMRTIPYEEQVKTPYEASFSSLSWHFFSSLTVRRMQLVRGKTMEEYVRNVQLRKGGLLILPEKRSQKDYYYYDNNNTPLAGVLFTCAVYFHNQIKTQRPSDEMAEPRSPKSDDLSSAFAVAAVIGALSL